MHALTTEQRAFLLQHTRTGKLATVRQDGRPHVVPIWFDLDDNTFVFTTWRTTIKAVNIRRDPRVCLCIDDETPPFAYMQIEGTATMTADSDALLYWATRIGARYMGNTSAAAYGKRNSVEGELLVQITPIRVIFEKDIAT